MLRPFNDRIEWVDADLLDFASLDLAFQNVQQVYHCAAMISYYQKDAAQMMKTNVEGTANVVNLCLEHKVQKLVHTSSVAALGNPKAGEQVTEMNFWDAYDKNGNYAVSKYQSEMEVWRGINEGLNAVIVNPALIIGHRAGPDASGKIFTTIQKGLKFYTSGSLAIVDVEDVAAIMIKLMESDFSAERFSLISENYSFQRFFNEIADTLSVKRPSVPARKWQLMLLWRFNALLKLLKGSSLAISKEMIQAALSQTRFSNQKIKLALAYEFKPVQKSIQETVSSMKQMA